MEEEIICNLWKDLEGECYPGQALTVLQLERLAWMRRHVTATPREKTNGGVAVDDPKE